MLKLVRKDILLSLSNKYLLNKWLFILIPMFVLILGNNLTNSFINEYLIFQLPTVAALFSTFIFYTDKSILNNYALIQSLPVKRWEYVISKYLLLFINYSLIMGYILLMFKIFLYFGFRDTDYIGIVSVMEALIISLASFAVTVPITFLFSGRFRSIFIFPILSIVTLEYTYEHGRGLNGLIQNLKEIKSPIIIIIIYCISIGLSIWIYNRKDLG